MTPTFWNRLWLSALAVAAALVWLLSCVGCAHQPPHHLTLPTAASVNAQIGKPALAARASNATAARIAAKAETSGLAAGSAEAHELTLSVAETDQHLAEVLAGKDQLVAQFGTLQLQVDALEKHDAAQTQLASVRGTVIKKVTRSRWIWRGLFALSLVLDYFAGGFMEARLRGAVAFLHAWLARGYHLAAGILKGLFPLYLCWLPA